MRCHPRGSCRPPVRRVAPAVAAALSALFAACSSGGDPYSPGVDLPATSTEALRFLQRATFGPDATTLQRVQYLGYATWLQEQQEAAPSLQAPVLAGLAAGGTSLGQSHRQEIWWRNAIRGRDQLRQRVAFALSEVFVVSDRADALASDVVGLASYYDMLALHAFADYRTLLEQVTRHPGWASISACCAIASRTRRATSAPTRTTRAR